jgi:hypothetical protein
MSPSGPPLTETQLDDLQNFLKDWLRHNGRTQADLRRALRATSIRMPALLEVLQRIHSQQGLSGLAERLCGIEDLWCGEDGAAGNGVRTVPGLDESLGQLDLLLQEIREDRDD